jgi:2,4-dienoyl-CoA reductase (NADPH2)
VNGALGQDQDYEIQPAPKKKKVAVVGGGPAGMEAARVAAIRGHEVVLYEKQDRLGGLLPWVAMIKGLDVDRDVTRLSAYLENQIIKLGVKIRLGEEFKPSLISEIKPDAVILATGGIPAVPQIRGVNRGNVISIDEIYRRVKEDLDQIEPGVLRWMERYWDFIGKRVVIIGGTIEGSGLAEFLAERCRTVTVVDEDLIWGDDPLVRTPSMEKVIRMPEVRCEEITDKGVVITTSEGRKQTIEADTIITASSPRLNTDFLKAVEGSVSEVYLIGVDDKEPSSIMNAIGNGYKTAKAL